MNWTEEEYLEMIERRKQGSNTSQERWTSAEYNEYLRTGKVPGQKVKSKPKVANQNPEILSDEETPIKKKRKYRNKKIELDGIVFDSQKEGKYYLELKERLQRKEIQQFELQPKFELQPGFKNRDGKKIRGISYVGDFKIWHNDGSIEIVDTKGFKTKEFRIKQKIFEYKYPEIKLSIV